MAVHAATMVDAAADSEIDRRMTDHILLKMPQAQPLPPRTQGGADYDIAIIGGGINGVGIARDAAGRGLKVLLVEQGDLASGTSSASSKLIHGGLRYLEQGAFRLVREALTEREILLRMAPHIVRPMRFVMPIPPQGRSPLMLRIGLMLYDWLGRRDILPGTQTLDLTHHPFGDVLQRPFGTAFEYSDCWVDDARLVVLNAVDAASRGASIRTRARCTRAERGEVWRLSIMAQGRRESITARALVNAGGPWVNQISDNIIRMDAPHARLVKGSHILVRRLYDHDRAYILQNDDGRVIFTIPFAGDYTMIGTTDLDFDGEPSALTAQASEIAYLCRAVSAYFREPVEPGDVVKTFSGVRALYDSGIKNPKDATRDYKLRLDEGRKKAPLLTVYGGKITTYRRLAEAAMAKLDRHFTASGPWTDCVPLPGGDFSHDRLDRLIDGITQRWPFVKPAHARRLAQAYGTRVDLVFEGVIGASDLGESFGNDLVEAEVRYLMAYEWAKSADDVLWRRTKLGLKTSEQDEARLAAFMARH